MPICLNSVHLTWIRRRAEHTGKLAYKAFIVALGLGNFTPHKTVGLSARPGLLPLKVLLTWIVCKLLRHKLHTLAWFQRV